MKDFRHALEWWSDKSHGPCQTLLCGVQRFDDGSRTRRKLKHPAAEDGGVQGFTSFSFDAKEGFAHVFDFTGSAHASQRQDIIACREHSGGYDES